jgi:hypothetical protein
MMAIGCRAANGREPGMMQEPGPCDLHRASSPSQQIRLTAVGQAAERHEADNVIFWKIRA